jgi:3-oxoacyl-[acyl-carrier-protein] synthase-1/3-oxoacyl-[acyl-carrier-protein] synthase II
VGVTGDGAVCALGATVAQCLAGLYQGRVQAPGPWAPSQALESPSPVFEVVADLVDVRARDGRPLSRTSQLALLALREALATAGAGGARPPSPERVGVIVGTTVGCTFNDEPFYRAFRAGQAPGLEAVERYVANDLAEVLAEELGARGPRATVTNACASGTDAIGLGARWIASGRCDRVIAGGADALALFPYLGFRAMNMAPVRPRPFDLSRQGLNLGEGAGVVVLESEAAARARGARCLGFVAGYGSGADAFHPTRPHPEGRGLRAALAAALADAALAPEAIGFVNAHGTGTLENDRVEGCALAALLPHRPPIVATKGMTGHTLGAAGALEAIFTLRNLLDGQLPASAGFQTPDPACAIIPTVRLTPTEARAALSDSLAFGGANAALVLLRGDPA